MVSSCCRNIGQYKPINILVTGVSSRFFRQILPRCLVARRTLFCGNARIGSHCRVKRALRQTVGVFVLAGIAATNSQAAVVVVDLRSDLGYQNQRAALPAGNGETQQHFFSIAGIEVGSGTFSLHFSLANSLSETGNISERDARIEAIADMVHPLYDPGLLSFAENVWINDSMGWTNENRSVGIFRYIHIISPESTSNAGNFNDGLDSFAAFRLQDGMDYYYGYLQLRVSDYPDQPAISIVGYAIETAANQAILTAAIPASVQQCTPGSYSADGNAPGVPAPPGYYVPGYGATNIIPASPGYFVAEYGATNQTPARAGHYCPFPAMSYEIPAPPGYYVAVGTSAVATAADPGFIVPFSGSTNQEPVAAGFYAPASGLSQGIITPPGYYTAVSGQSNLTVSPVGHYVAIAGANQATPVEAGKVAPIVGMQQAMIPGDIDGDDAVTQSELDTVVGKFWETMAWTSIGAFDVREDGTVSFALTNALSSGMSVYVSTNLPDFAHIGTATPWYQFTDFGATNAGSRFYRLEWP